MKILAVFIGCLMAFMMLAASETFFYFNGRFAWVRQPTPRYVEARRDKPYDPGALGFSYLKDLTPYPEPSDILEPEDWSSMWKFQDCAEPRPLLTPYWLGVPNCKTRATMKKLNSRRIVYDTHYTYNRHALRIVPAAKADSKNFLLHIGCSFTQGEGVGDEETFVNHITKKVVNVNAFNLGTGGYGTNHMLQLLEQDPSDLRLSAITGESGVAVYHYIDDHIRRTVGTMVWLKSKSKLEDPFYELQNGRPVHSGTFESGRPFTSSILRLLGMSETIKFLNVDVPKITESHVDLFVAMVLEMKKILETRYHVKTFIVSVLPEEGWYVDMFAQRLRDNGVTVFDYSGVDAKSLTHGRYYIFGNGHPSPLGHRLYSDLFVQDWKKAGIKFQD